MKPYPTRRSGEPGRNALLEHPLELFQGLQESFHPRETLEILDKWLEVIACSQGTVYEDWQERSEAFSLCRQLQGLFQSLADTRQDPGTSWCLRELPAFYLGEKEYALLSRITRVIRESVPAEKILCFCAGQHARLLKTCWMGPIFSPVRYTFHLLVLIGKDPRPDHELQDLIESRCSPLALLTAIVHPLDFAQEMLNQGHPFFTAICRMGAFLYGGDPFQSPGNLFNLDPEQVKTSGRKAWIRWSRSAEGFFRGVEFHLISGDLRLAIFMLHQAAENICTGLIMAVTGYRPGFHNLDKLLRLTRCFTEKLWEIFPRDTPEEIGWFLKLQKAYSRSRYSESYEITAGEIQVLLVRVRKLQGVAKETYECWEEWAGAGLEPGDKTMGKRMRASECDQS